MNRKGKIMLDRAEEPLWAFETEKDYSNLDLVLLDNVQFIYELSLAKMELQTLGAEFELSKNLREFSLCSPSKEVEQVIQKRSAYFRSVFGNATDYFQIIQKNRTRSVNQYLTHWIYPYKGKFHPQMIRALLNIIGINHNDVVLDPFIGSGTTALETQLLGINFVGLDVSPLCVIQGNVKTKSLYCINEIIEAKNEVINNITPNIFQQETNYYKMIEGVSSNEDVITFYKLARLVAISDFSRRKRNYEKSFIERLNLMIDSVLDYSEIKNRLNLKLGDVDIKTGDARELEIPSNSIDGIITSPPYSIALDYVDNDVHSLQDLGYNVKSMREEFIGVRGIGKKRIDLYNEDMKKSYDEMFRVLKPGKFAVIVIGNATYQSKQIETVEYTINYMHNIGMELAANIDKIIFGLYNVMKKENILIFRKG